MGTWQDAGWPVVRIRDIGRLYGGGTPSRRRPEFFEGTIPWITGQDIPESYVATITTARDHITPQAVAGSATRIAAPGAVLVTTRVAVGKTAVAGVPLCFSQDVTAIEIHAPSIALPAFVAHFLRSRREVLLQKNQGSTIAGITRNSLALERIPLPTIGEQQRIVDLLNAVEEIRQLQDEADAIALELIPAFFRQIFGDCGRNPKGWRKVRISDVVQTFEGGRSVTGVEGSSRPTDPRVLKISAVTSGTFAAHENKPIPAGYDPPVAHYVRAGDLLISRANTEALVGATALVPDDCPPNLVLPDKIWRFVWKPEFRGTPEFVWALFQEQPIRRMIRRMASGSGGSMKNISMQKLMQMRVVWPPETLQKSFSQIVKQVTSLRISTRSNELMASLSASLTFDAFTGEITAAWREENRDKINLEAKERDSVLGAVAAALSRAGRDVPPEGPSELDLQRDVSRAELNREQMNLLASIHREFGKNQNLAYFNAPMLGELLDGHLRRNPHAVEGHLGVLAAQGLIIPVSRGEQTEDTGEFIFGNAYRLPRGMRSPAEEEDGPGVGDRVRLPEMERLGSLITARGAEP